MVQKKPFLQSQLCALASLPLLAPLSSALNPCSCGWVGGLSVTDAGLSAVFSSGEAQKQHEQEQEEGLWCVLDDPCLDLSLGAAGGSREEECVFRVDPFREACAVFLVDLHTSLPPAQDTRDAAGLQVGPEEPLVLVLLMPSHSLTHSLSL